MKAVKSTRGGKRKSRRKTGAPPASFLLYATTDLGGVQDLRVLIEKSFAERKTFRSMSTEDLAKQCWWALVELAARVLSPRLKGGRLENAAEDLAVIGTVAASFLEVFARSDSGCDRACVELAARAKNYWPVLLRLGERENRDGERVAVLEGAEKAKDYLCKIRLGENAPTTGKVIGGHGSKPFTRAAARLLQALLDWRERDAWRGKVSPWSKKVLLLEKPMTTDNVDEWWAVAKLWMDEQWETNRVVFEPLIRHLKLDNPGYTPSLVRRRVLDDSLKKAFKALAVPSSL